MPKPLFPTLVSCTVAALAFVTPAASCRAQDIPVGEFASLTGNNATFGDSSHKGTALAIDELNAKGGVLNGEKLRLITEDDRSVAGEPANIVSKLISSDKVVAVLGEVASSKSLEAAPICQAKRIPMISPASTNPGVTEIGGLHFPRLLSRRVPGKGDRPLRPRHPQGQAGRAAARREAGLQHGAGKFIKDTFTAGGGQIVAEKSYSSGDKDFKAQLASIKTMNPDVLFVPGYYTEVGLIARQARQSGIKAPLMGGDGWDSPNLIPTGGSALEGDYFTDHFVASNPVPVVPGFRQTLQGEYNSVPDAMAALGYDSAMLLADSIKRAGTTEPDKLRAAIADTKDFDGVTGKITIDAKRNASKSAVMIEIKDKQFLSVATLQP